MFECIVFLNQYKVALSGYALRDFINLVVMHWMSAYEKLSKYCRYAYISMGANVAMQCMNA